MKISAQEEYGLRILLRLARSQEADGLSIPRISELEGLTTHNVAKLCRLLRLAGFIQSSRGKEGGYLLTRPAHKIHLSEVLGALGGRLYEGSFCANHTGVLNLCTNTVDCSIRSLWQVLQDKVDEVLYQFTLADLLDAGELAARTQNCEQAASAADRGKKNLLQIQTG